MSRKEIPRSKYRADVVTRLLFDADIQEQHADDETGGSHITARLEREAAEELRRLRVKLEELSDRDHRRLVDMQKRTAH